MQNQYDLVKQLTSSPLDDVARRRGLNDFAHELGWRPSDQFFDPEVSGFSNAHLMVEHGLENAAVISFLDCRNRFSDLSTSHRQQLLRISYNNLVEWHISIHPDEVTFVFNRTDPPTVVAKRQISRESFEALRCEVFEQVTGKRPNPNIPALDDALIRTISSWKRSLSAELRNAVPNEAFSSLFNAIIFARAVEDNFRRLELFRGKTNVLLPVLLSVWDDVRGARPTVGEAIQQAIARFVKGRIPTHLLDAKVLRTFDSLDRRTVRAFFTEFYKNKYAPYPYDFSLISKHALSRIYEHYVSLLRLKESPQLTLLEPLPEEERDRAFGNFYTPQFVARFFARYLREELTPRMFRNLRVLEPACGSGIFLRNILELQCDPSQDDFSSAATSNAFRNILGLDVDKNACNATLLSLSLLHYVLTNKLPTLKILNQEAVQYFKTHSSLKDSCDVVVANPPFVALTMQSEETRRLYDEFLGEHASGRIDAFLPFLKIGLEALKPGGFGLFVLPHSFLLGKSSAGMRELLAKEAWVRCLADLSAIRVFESSDTYVVLLIFQKKTPTSPTPPPVTVVKCQDLVGLALEDVINGRQAETSFYSVYQTDQGVFESGDWMLLPPTEAALALKFRGLPKIEDFLEVRQGFVSGADSVFIVPKERIPKGEEEVFVPVLRDREMETYTVPGRTSHYFFYPFLGDRPLKESELKDRFTKTWKYLLDHKTQLQERAPVKRRNCLWWEPAWPRSPERMMRPKIVTPHLVVVPRFSLDLQGKYSVSHAPLMYPRDEGTEEELLKFFLGVLNSSPCYWFIREHSHRYQRGYTMLESKTLSKVPVPDPREVAPVDMRNLLGLVDKRLKAPRDEGRRLEAQIDELVTKLYGLTEKEKRIFSLEL